MTNPKKWVHAKSLTPDDLKTSGEELRNRREGYGWSVPELARRSGLSVRTIFFIESGNRGMTVNTLFLLANAFCCEPCELLWELYGGEPQRYLSVGGDVEWGVDRPLTTRPDRG